MRQITRVTCCTAAVVAMAACGTTSVSPGSGSPSSQPAVLPLTITRAGGIAGFQDELVVAGDGLVSVTRRGQKQRQCRLTPEAVKKVTTAASQVPWDRITPDSGQASVPDDMVTMVRSPAGGPVRLEDPKVGAAGKVFAELLNDANAGPALPPASRMCTDT